MTFEEYIETCSNFLKENPEAGKMQVLSYEQYSPCEYFEADLTIQLGVFQKDSQVFTSHCKDEIPFDKPNAVLIY